MSLQQHSEAFPVTLSDKDWARIIQNGRAAQAQELLSTAIAQNDQYREEDPIKRKGVLASSTFQSHGPEQSQDDSQEAPDLDHGNNSSDEGHSPEGKPAPKKAGRKPLTTEPTNKRKAQNRAAQRAFRDRKERYVKSLEDRVKELEDGQGLSTDSKLAEENLTLKVLLQKLETENYILKEQAFTFDFPISQPGLYNIAKANRDMQLAQARAQATSSSTSSPATQVLDSASAASSPSTVTTAVPEIQAATTTSKTGTAKPVQFDQLPWSPPSSIGDSVPNSPLDHDLGAPEQDSTLQLNQVEGAAGVVPKFRQSSPEELALFSSILDGSGNTYASQSAGLAGISTTSANALAALSGVTSSSTLEQLMNVPLFGATVNGSVRFGPTLTSTASSTVASNTSIAAMSPLTVGGASSTELPLMPMFTFDQSHALFSNFRDPSDPQEFFASLEDPIEPTTGLFDGNFLDYSEAFSGVISEGQQSKDDILKLSGTAPAATAMAVTGGSGDDNERKLKGLPSLAENEQAIPCPQAWEHIAKHPNFDEADIDELCTEMKAKAKCSGHGPMIALKDVDNLLTKLD